MSSSLYSLRNLSSWSRPSRMMVSCRATVLATRRTGGTINRAPIGVSASFSTGAVRRAGKESSLGKEDRADEVERAKHEQLREQKEGRGQWKDELASDSESIVKADRGEFNANQETIKKLQEETEKMAKKSR